ncbi:MULTISPECIES: hypothetical protein [unclassified Microbacterium]|uniref:hypothetical protein n=1 Tax=unclassified Microbacterium TaxID=2609290 RepID=UPI000EAA9120|nr:MULTISPECIES: hypothetical protein [unclassified Microbacterium]MBT2486423.1 hypothetical protein [Microbacterium sp. ISL-108]RKN69125.1 hypothetical protein D7252_17125 [Microbacterium sp. CGR2]
MTKATQAAQTTWLIIASLLSQLAVWVAFVSQYGDSREIDGACFRSAPDTAVFIGEYPQVVADVTFMPIGRACIYEATTGGTITVQTGEAVIALAVIGTAVCLVAAITAWSRWKRLTPMQRLLPGVALFFLALGWLTIWLHAAGR